MTPQIICRSPTSNAFLDKLTSLDRYVMGLLSENKFVRYCHLKGIRSNRTTDITTGQQNDRTLGQQYDRTTGLQDYRTAGLQEKGTKILWCWCIISHSNLTPDRFRSCFIICCLPAMITVLSFMILILEQSNFDL